VPDLPDNEKPTSFIGAGVKRAIAGNSIAAIVGLFV
jgi:hypothetical protein